MKKPLIVYGAGGLGREILSWVSNMEQWNVLGFIDDGLSIHQSVDGFPILGGIERLNQEAADVNVLLAIGDPCAKAEIRSKITNSHIHFPAIIHPSVIISNPNTVSISDGVIICAGTILTTHIKVGQHVLLNLNCTVGHDASIGSYASIMPGVNIAGGVTIGEKVLVGSGANIMNRIRLGDRAKVGMGSTVINDVSNDTTVVGVPAKPIIK